MQHKTEIPRLIIHHELNWVLHVQYLEEKMNVIANKQTTWTEQEELGNKTRNSKKDIPGRYRALRVVCYSVVCLVEKEHALTT